MTFEEWLRRPVYVAQCTTMALASKLGVFCHSFRALPGYRDAAAMQARLRVANEVRAQRAARHAAA